MSYTIIPSNGENPFTIRDGTLYKDLDLTLIGRNSTSFGEIVNQDLFYLLENFANGTSPKYPVTGQLWYNTSDSRLEVYTGRQNGWRATGAPIVSQEEPTSLVTGDLWIDNKNKQLWFFDGSALTLAGPQWTQSQGTTGLVAETLYDSIYGNARPVLKLFVNNYLLGIYSAYEFTPKPPIPGFSTISKGYTSVSGQYTSEAGATSLGTLITVTTTFGLEVGMTVTVLTGPTTNGIGAFAAGTTVTNVVDQFNFIVSQLPTIPLSNGAVVLGSAVKVIFNVDVTNSQKLNGIVGTNYLRKDVNSTMNGQLSITTDLGLLVGSGSNGSLSVTGTTLSLKNTSGDISIVTKDTGAVTNSSIYIQSSNNRVGIRTTSPQRDFDVNGNTRVTGTFEVTGKILTKSIPLTLTGTDTNTVMQPKIILILNDVANPVNYINDQQALVHYQKIDFSNSSITRYLKRYKIASGAWVFDRDLTSSV